MSEEAKRKYEIINPSDKCFITAEKDVACYVGLLLGSGKYGVEDAETGETALPIMLLATDQALDQWSVDTFGELFEDWAKKLDPAKIAEGFESFEYEGERSSMNNIGALAAKYADRMRAKAAEAK